MGQPTYDFYERSDMSRSLFLSLPLELRHQIYTHLFSSASKLTLQSLFIRSHYLNIFMTQQSKQLSPAILRVCKQITAETLPRLYAAPRWACGCRVEALAVQIGRANFARIRLMQVDVDDLDFMVESLQSTRQRRIHRGSGFAMQEIPIKVPEVLRLSTDDENLDMRSPGWKPIKTLDFSNLEVLEVDGFQSAALTNRGTHRVRVEALRLCELAMQLMDFHPKLKYLLQRGPKGDGGADARDLTLGRVRWKFVKDLNMLEARQIEKHAIISEELNGGLRHEDEQVVDLSMIRTILEHILKEDESRIESSLPVAWTSDATGRFHLYPYLQSV